MRKLWLVSWVLLGLVSIARADAVGIPDDLPPCPAGSALTVNHAGHWCREETPCADDSGCASSEQCSAAVALCVGTETYTQGGRLATDRPTTHTIRVGRGPCDASCVPPATCETSRRCTPRPTPSAPTAASAPTAPTAPASSACHASRTSRSRLASLTVLAALLLSLGRRARPR
jgi:hypothetical protein